MHLKRIKAPKFWKTPRKQDAWVVAPKPGPHKKLESIPLQVLLRDILKITDVGSDARKIVKQREVLVDGKVRKDHGYGVGLFDVVTIPKLNKNYRAVPSQTFRSFIEIDDSEAKKKICKIADKTIIGKGKIQLNLHDGKTVLTEDKKFKTGDTIVVELPSLKIIDHIPLEAGVTGVVIRGTQVGRVGKVKGTKKATSRQSAKVICEFENGEQNISKERFFIVGKDKPSIKMGE